MKKDDIVGLTEATAKGLVGIIPGGGLLVEYYDFAKAKVLDKRYKDWQALVENRLENLQMDIEHLADDDFFFSCFQLATANAAKAHQQEKVEMFANALFNGLSLPNISEDKKMFFLNLLDKYTLNTIRLLGFFSESHVVEQNVKRSGMVTTYTIGGTEHPIKHILEALPEYNSDGEYVRSIATQLANDGLVEVIDWRMPVSQEQARCKRTTTLGDEFISYITYNQ